MRLGQATMVRNASGSGLSFFLEDRTRMRKTIGAESVLVLKDVMHTKEGFWFCYTRRRSPKKGSTNRHQKRSEALTALVKKPVGTYTSSLSPGRVQASCLLLWKKRMRGRRRRRTKAC